MGADNSTAAKPADGASNDDVSECFKLGKELKACGDAGGECKEEFVAFYACIMSKVCTEEWKPVDQCLSLGKTIDECIGELSMEQALALGTCNVNAAPKFEEVLKS